MSRGGGSASGELSASHHEAKDTVRVIVNSSVPGVGLGFHMKFSAGGRVTGTLGPRGLYGLSQSSTGNFFARVRSQPSDRSLK